MEACGKKTSVEIVEKNGVMMASALIEKDRSKAGEVWEIARGPLWSDEATVCALCQDIVKQAVDENVTSIYFSPTVPLPSFDTRVRPSGRRVHAEATRIIDLAQSEEEILSQMHQKGRYNIRIAEKAGVTVRKGSVDDIDAFYALLVSTSQRDGFKASQKVHYSRFLTSLEGSFILMAEHEKKPIAGLLGVIWNGVGIYYYGASEYASRALMAPYLLQWEAMRVCKQQGCVSYDLLGIAASDAASDPWAGISDFKRKFGGTVITYPPEQMIVLKPVRKFIIDQKRRFLG